MPYPHHLPGGACWVARKVGELRALNATVRSPTRRAFANSRALRVLSSSCHCSRGKGEPGWEESRDASAHGKFCICFVHPSCFFPKKNAHKCGKPIISRGIELGTTPHKEVVDRLVGHFKDLSTYLSQIFLRQEPQQCKKKTSLVSLML